VSGQMGKSRFGVVERRGEVSLGVSTRDFRGGKGVPRRGLEIVRIKGGAGPCPTISRVAPGGMEFHVLNRAVERSVPSRLVFDGLEFMQDIACVPIKVDTARRRR